MKAESSSGDPESDDDILGALGLGEDSDDGQDEEEEEEDDIGRRALENTPGAFWTEEDEDDDIVVNDILADHSKRGVTSAEHDHGTPSAECQAILDEFGLGASEDEDDGCKETESDNHGHQFDAQKKANNHEHGADAIEQVKDGGSCTARQGLQDLGLEDSKDNDEVLQGGCQLGLANEQGAPCNSLKSHDAFVAADSAALESPRAPLSGVGETIEKPLIDTACIASGLHENSPDALRNSLAERDASPEKQCLSPENENDEAALLRRVSNYLSTNEEDLDHKEDPSMLLDEKGEIVEQDTTAMSELDGLSDMEAFTRMALGRSSLSLKDLRIQSLEPLFLHTLTGLTSLRLPGNEFNDVKELARSLETLTSLTDLDLSRCQLKELPVLQHLPHLRRFDASQNNLRSSRGILYCTDLRHVNLSYNQLRRVEQLETLTLLEELNLAYNRLGPSVLAAMRTVAACSHLRVLHVAGNPFSSQSAHRVQITDLIPSLELIDDRRVQTLRITRKTAKQANQSFSLSNGPLQGKPPVLDQSESMLETSISYGILAQSSPKRLPRERNVQTSVSVRKRVETPTRLSTRNPAVTPSRQLKGKQAPAKPVLGSPEKKPCTSPSKPWVVAACLASPPPPTHVHEIHGRRVKLRSPFKIKPEVTDSHTSSALLEELKRIDELDAEMESVTGEADAETISNHSEKQFSLSDLLQEKRRLLHKVSAQLSGGVGTLPFPGSLPKVPALPSNEAMSVDRQAAFAHGAAEVIDIAASTQEVRSLLASLRDGIERKRSLLEQLQHA